MCLSLSVFCVMDLLQDRKRIERNEEKIEELSVGIRKELLPVQCKK